MYEDLKLISKCNITFHKKNVLVIQSNYVMSESQAISVSTIWNEAQNGAFTEVNIFSVGKKVQFLYPRSKIMELFLWEWKKVHLLM